MKTLKKELRNYASLKRKKANEWFFKTKKGEYGYGDKFIGVSMPNVRKVVAKYKDLSLNNVKMLLDSTIHEERMTGALILTKQYPHNKEKIYKFYMKNKKRINNWDLVDCSTPHIVGSYLVERQDEVRILYKLARSKSLWDRRIAIIATMRFIDKGYVDECLKISKFLLKDKEDLIHKAVGWMLREKSHKTEEFLKRNYEKLPRTTLRYAIERMEEGKRKRILKGEF